MIKLMMQTLEISSMGIRVDSDSLTKQAKISRKKDSDMGEYHKLVLNQKLPYTIGGGIGQSRLSMFLLEKKHIGEVQASVWPDEHREFFEKEGVILL